VIHANGDWGAFQAFRIAQLVFDSRNPQPPLN
jgi:hypothetical protein